MSDSLTHQALENLVTQFSSAMDCLRELVQNSMDAGSPQVDVWTEFIDGDEAGEGTICLHVDDDGLGMDEQIIDEELTRLFASSKEDDLTKIGKFGIGFVSIFALGPEAVLLHTGRGGECWEILFHADRSFTKTRIDGPVEGTKLTLYLPGDEDRYADLVAQARATLKRWCRHSDIDIYFEDRSGVLGGEPVGEESINEPFEVSGTLATHLLVKGTEMALCYDLEPQFEFYNKGLTLAVMRDVDEMRPRFRNLSFKIKSKYLEHTLSRETVLRDRNFDKAMALLVQAADGPLHDALVSALETLVAAPEWGLAEATRYRELLVFLEREPAELVRAAGEKKILRLVDGGGTSLDEVVGAAGRDGRIFVTEAPSPLTAALRDSGVPVVFGELGGGSAGAGEPSGDEADRGARLTDPVVRLLAGEIGRRRGRKLFRRFVARVRAFLDLSSVDQLSQALGLVQDPARVYLSVSVDSMPPADAARLIARAGELLGEVGAGYRRVGGCVLQSPTADPPLFVVGRRLNPLMALPPPGVAAGERSRRPEAAVNRDHPQFRALLELHQVAPQLAEYCLAKDLLLIEDRLLERDVDLLAAAWPDLQRAGSPPEPEGAS